MERIIGDLKTTIPDLGEVINTLKRFKKIYSRDEELKNSMPNKFFSKYLNAIEDRVEVNPLSMQNVMTSVRSLISTTESIIKLCEDKLINEAVARIYADNVMSIKKALNEMILSLVSTVNKGKEMSLLDAAYRSGKLVRFYNAHSEELKEVPVGYDLDFLKGFLKEDSLSIWDGFFGNPFFHFGRRRIRMRRIEKERLEAQRKFLNYELTALELDENSKPEVREYYKKEIEKLNMEIAEMSS